MLKRQSASVGFRKVLEEQMENSRIVPPTIKAPSQTSHPSFSLTLIVAELDTPGLLIPSHTHRDIGALVKAREEEDIE